VDPVTGAVKKTIIEPSLGRVVRLAYFSGGSLFAVGIRSTGRFSQVFLWNVFANRLTPLSKSQEALGASAVFSPDGETAVITMRKYLQCEIGQYETKTGALVRP